MSDRTVQPAPIRGSVDIASGGSLSPAIPFRYHRLAAIAMPVAWTAAALTFQVSADDGATYQDLYDAAGNEVSITVAAGHTVRLDSLVFRPFQFVKIRSGTGGVPVVQAAKRTLGFIGLPQ